MRHCVLQKWCSRVAESSGKWGNRIMAIIIVVALIIGVMLVAQGTFSSSGQRPVKKVSIVVEDKRIEIAKKVTANGTFSVYYDMWTFNGTVPGPVIHVRQGDVVDFTLINRASIGHSLDFHAAKVDWKTKYRTMGPNQTLSWQFETKYPGVFMYHCGTPPVLEHIAKGLYGMIVVDPINPLPRAKEFFIVQSEYYVDLKERYNPETNETYFEAIDNMSAMESIRPAYVTFNGYAGQYVSKPLEVGVGEPVRLYVVNAGPSVFSAFHIIGTVFDRVYPDGNPSTILRGQQTYTIPPGGGAAFDFSFDEPGQNPFVTHSFAYPGLGAVGLFKVTSGQQGGGEKPPEQPTQSVTVDMPLGAGIPGFVGAFSPDIVVVKIGVNNTVVWTNSDSMPHTVTARDGSFDSGNMDPGAVFTYTFTKPGTYEYVCLYHATWMTGKVIVLAAG